MGQTLSSLKEELSKKRFIRSIIDENEGEVYFVGGIVRDLLLEKPNKDIDLVVRKVNIDLLINILYKFGRVDIVGKSFGIIKFKSDEDNQEYDIALPRQEVATGEGGHRGFSVAFDENLPIEKDLIRRDAKINAMAVRINDGTFIDPLHGLDDITNKIISMANPDSFSDDPLRMLRVIGFASRFEFDIERVTYDEIRKNASRITEISAERVLIEFDKIVRKGDQMMAAGHLIQSGILGHLLKKTNIVFMGDSYLWDHSKTMGEFIYLLLRGSHDTPSNWYKFQMKGDVDTFNELKALELAMVMKGIETKPVCRKVVKDMYKFSPKSIDSLIIPKNIIEAATEMREGKYPLSFKEMKLNGDDLLEMGYTGELVGHILKALILEIYFDHAINEKEKLITFVKETYPHGK